MKTIEKFTNFIGEKVSYLIPVMTAMMVVVIISRYFFGIGRTGMQELVMYFHAMVFLGCAGFVFNKDDHVRVDIYYRDSSKKYKNFINLIFFHATWFALKSSSLTLFWLWFCPFSKESWKVGGPI